MINRLEGLASSGRKLPVGGKRLIDPARLLELVDQMRLAVPQDIQEAQDLLMKREVVISHREQQISQAQAEAVRIKNAAEAESRSLLEESQLVKEAEGQADQKVQEGEKRAQRLVEYAQSEAKDRMANSDAYAQDVLYKLEQEVTTILTTVRRGIEALEDNRAPSKGDR